MTPLGLQDFYAAGPLASLLVTLVVFAGLWRYSVAIRNCGVVDLYWGYGFAVVAAIEFALGGRADTARVVFVTMVCLWAIRLGRHLVQRHRGAKQEDFRYRDMRLRNGEGWERRSFWVVFMLQAVVLWVVASPIHAALAGPAIEPAPIVLGIGVMIFAIGFVIEAAADSALASFRRDAANRGGLLTTGLFSWSRHPHYFGEATLWWGLGLFAYGLSGSWVALVGPAILNLLLVKVSGVPLVEEHLAKRPGFEAWAARTSVFIPRPPLPERVAAPSPAPERKRPGARPGPRKAR